jgi:hypothetical protein
MDYGIKTFFYSHKTNRPACHCHHSCLSVGDIKGIDITLDEVDILPDRLALRILGWADFGSDRELSDI